MESSIDFEVSTLTYALLQQYSPQISEKYSKEAFPNRETFENAESIIKSLPSDFIQKLITSNLPNTNYPSLIRNTKDFCSENQSYFEKRKKLFYKTFPKIALSHRIIGHTRLVNTIFNDPNGLIFISGSEDTNIKIWHFDSLSLMLTLKGHEDGVVKIAMSKDRKLLASIGKNEQYLRLWSMVDGSAVCLYNCFHDAVVTDVEFSPCGQFCVVTSSNGSVLFLEVAKKINRLVTADKIISSYFSGNSNNINLSESLYSNDSIERYNAIEPLGFLSRPPAAKKQIYLKSPINKVKFSSGGCYSIYALESGDITIIHNSKIKWNFHAHDAAVDDVGFFKNSFHYFYSLSSKSGEIKIWNFSSKIINIACFSVRTNSRRNNIIGFAISYDETIIAASTSNSLYMWKIDDSSTPILHVEDKEQYIKESENIDFHPFLPNIILLSSKSYITIWDAFKSESLIHTLIIPVETPRIHKAQWSPDGLSIIASDALGGIFIFRVSDEGPECRITPQFFPSDFSASFWIDGYGQIEDTTRIPTNKNPRNVLTDNAQVPVYQNYTPISFKEIEITPVITSSFLSSWLNEELWYWTNKVEEHQRH